LLHHQRTEHRIFKNLYLCYHSAMNKTTDFFTFTTERSTIRTVSLLGSSIVVCFFPVFLLIVLKYEKNLHRRTILNYLAADFCVVFAFLFVVIQTIEILRFTFGPLPLSVCYIQTVSRRSCVYLFYFILNSQAAMKYVLIFIWKSPFGFQDDFWYFFIKCLIIHALFIIQFVMEFMRRFRTLEFYICIGKEPDYQPVTRYITYVLIISTIFIQFGVWVRSYFFNRSNNKKNNWQEARISEIETESVLNYHATISAGSALCVTSMLFMHLNKVKPSDLNNQQYLHVLFWRSFGVASFSAPFFCIFTLKNKRFRNHLKNLINSNKIIIFLRKF